MNEALEENIINAYNVEKYAEISLLMLFLKHQDLELRKLSAKLVLESKEHEENMKNILRKMGLSKHLKNRVDYGYSRETLNNMDFKEILIQMVKNEIIAMNNYLELLIKVNRKEIEKYFEDPDKEFYSVLEEMVFEELDHAKRILNFIKKIRKDLN